MRAVFSKLGLKRAIKEDIGKEVLLYDNSRCSDFRTGEVIYPVEPGLNTRGIILSAPYDYTFKPVGKNAHPITREFVDVYIEKFGMWGRVMNAFRSIDTCDNSSKSCMVMWMYEQKAFKVHDTCYDGSARITVLNLGYMGDYFIEMFPLSMEDDLGAGRGCMKRLVF